MLVFFKKIWVKNTVLNQHMLKMKQFLSCSEEWHPFQGLEPLEAELVGIQQTQSPTTPPC